MNHLLIDLIALAYRAVDRTTTWEEFLDAFVASTPFSVSVLGYQNAIDDQFVAVTFRDADTLMIREFNDAISGQDLFYDAAVNRGAGQHVEPAAALVPREVLTQHPYYAWMSRHGVEDIVLSIESTPERGLINFPAFTPTGMRVGDDHVTLMRTLLPHVCHAISLARQFARFELELDSSRASLERADYGCLVLDARGRVEWMNPYARELLERDDVFSLARGHVLINDPERRVEFDRALAAALGLSQGKLERPSPIIELTAHARAHRAPVEALVSPIAPFGHPLFGPISGAIVLLADPEHVNERMAERLVARYGLTPTEAEVTQWLLSGESITRIAEIFGRSPDTVRTHVKRVLKKCNVHSQAELVGVLHRGLTRLA